MVAASWQLNFDDWIFQFGYFDLGWENLCQYEKQFV
jgi:hypothetical protein